MQARYILLFVIPLAVLNSGCAISSRALWRAGASRVGFEDAPRGMPTEAKDVEVYYKQSFGIGDTTEDRRDFACSTTTVLRKAFLVPTERTPAPDRSVVGLAHVTSEEFPRDEEGSTQVEPPEFMKVFGIGSDPIDLFEIEMDVEFLPDALARLRYYAAQLGADAVIEVFATGSAEYHAWEGFGLGFDTRSTSSIIYVGGTLSDFRLRDVRLHGIAVRYAD